MLIYSYPQKLFFYRQRKAFRERFLSPNFYKKRALTTENTESTEIFNRFFSVIFVISVVKNPLRNTLF